MKKFEFKQNELKRGVPFAVIYLVAVFAFCYIQFGGITGMADAVNSLGPKGAGLIVGFAVIAPFLVLLNFLMPKLTVEFFADEMTISKGKNEPKIVDYKDIETLQINVRNLNQLDILDRQNAILCSFQPQQDVEVLNEIISELSTHIQFTKQMGSKSYFGTNIETMIYTRKI